MKKCLTLIMLAAFISMFTTACSHKSSQKPNLIQSKRKFADFVGDEKPKDPNTIDLSEGPRLHYDAKFGPKALNFDIKIIDPY